MRLFILSIFIICGAFGIFVIGYALPNINTQIEKSLERAGFTNIETQGLKFSADGFAYEKIKTNHFTAYNFKASLKWPTYFFSHKINLIAVQKVSLKKDQLSQNFISTQHLADIKKLPEINIPDLTLPLTANTTISSSLIKNDNGIFGSLNTDLANLKLNGKWSVLWDDNDNITIDWDAQNISIAHDLIGLNRGNGWAEILIKDDPYFNLQLESGSGSILKAPLNNIRLVVGNEGPNHHLIFRSTASGTPDINLSSDIKWGENFKIDSGVTTLTMNSLDSFTAYLKNNHLFDKSEQSLDQFNNIEINISYLSERRFANGPHPFEIKITSDKKQVLLGNFLIYPNTLEVRGTLNGAPQILSLIMQIVPLQHDRLDKNNIRLDGRLLGDPVK